MFYVLLCGSIFAYLYGCTEALLLIYKKAKSEKVRVVSFLFYSFYFYACVILMNPSLTFDYIVFHFLSLFGFLLHKFKNKLDNLMASLCPYLDTI